MTEHDPEKPLGLLELLTRIGEHHLKLQNLAASITNVRAKPQVVLVTFGTDQITPSDVIRIGDHPWSQLPMTGLIVWMPTPMMQSVIRAYVAGGRDDARLSPRVSLAGGPST